MGEDAGLTKLQNKYGHDAQTNETLLINNGDHKAIVLIADSVGSHCELGLFSWLYTKKLESGFDKNVVSFFVIVDQQYKDHKSYFNEGPIKMLDNAGGKVLFCDFSTFDMNKILEPLKLIRVTTLQPNSG